MAPASRNVAAIHLGQRLHAASRNPPERLAQKQAGRNPTASSLFGFAPGGVCLAVCVAAAAVGSYPTLSPLPAMAGGLLSVALSLRSPSPDVIRHRVSVEPGLSSPHRLSALVKRGCPANWQRSHSGVRT